MNREEVFDSLRKISYNILTLRPHVEDITMFNKTPDNCFAAIFNVFQGLTMTLTVSFYIGQTDPVGLVKTFVCAYCAGVMLTMFLRVPAFGAWVARLFRCEDKPKAGYLVSNLAAGGLMGIFMNFFITFMNIGPVPYFPAAFLQTLLFSIVVSAISSTVWIGVTTMIMGKIYGKQPQA